MSSCRNLNGNSLSGRVPATLGGRLLHRASFKYVFHRIWFKSCRLNRICRCRGRTKEIPNFMLFVSLPFSYFLGESVAKFLLSAVLLTMQVYVVYLDCLLADLTFLLGLKLASHLVLVLDCYLLLYVQCATIKGDRISSELSKLQVRMLIILVIQLN